MFGKSKNRCVLCSILWTGLFSAATFLIALVMLLTSCGLVGF